MLSNFLVNIPQMVANAKGLLTKWGVQLITKNNKDCLGRDSEPKKALILLDLGALRLTVFDTVAWCS
ncbi:hypothetical protein DS742_05985 [Lacrimispora amygdalina]|uniref:Uncharacterized protein n=1 Tax=Lacrimispora amygdalina TaxID=253257 RepID=A0A3E2NG64_9FIRM|nr:hypothetical protein DS742_05985 [Clostridium indicum]